MDQPTSGNLEHWSHLPLTAAMAAGTKKEHLSPCLIYLTKAAPTQHVQTKHIALSVRLTWSQLPRRQVRPWSSFSVVGRHSPFVLSILLSAQQRRHIAVSAEMYIYLSSVLTRLFRTRCLVLYTINKHACCSDRFPHWKTVCWLHTSGTLLRQSGWA